MRRTLLFVITAVAALAVAAAAGSVQGRWVVRDLGTFGGPESHAVAANDSGQVVGSADTRESTKGSYGSTYPVERAFLWQSGKMRDLGTLGGPGSRAAAINDLGQVVGWANTGGSTKQLSGTYAIQRAFLWESGRMCDLGTFGGPESHAVAINDNGQIVGLADTTAKDKYGDPISHAFLWENGRMRDLGTFGGPGSEAGDINERGQVVGWADTKAGQSHAFLWQNGVMRDLGAFGGPESHAVDVNERGQVVGWAETTARNRDDLRDDPVHHAFLWQSGVMRDLGTFGGPDSKAVAINESGQIVGTADTPRTTPCGGDEAGPTYRCRIERGFLWQSGRLRDLGTLGGTDSDANGINERSQIVGTAYTKRGFHAYVWANGRMTDLGVALGPDSFGSAINDRGQILGRVYTKDGEHLRAALWTFRSG